LESSDFANSNAMRQLVEQRAALRSQLAEQSATLLDQHPRIKELKAQIGEADRQIKTEGERLARQLDNDAVVAATVWKRSRQASTPSRNSHRKATNRTCSCARLSARPKPNAICSNPIDEVPRSLGPRQYQRHTAGSAHYISRRSAALPTYPKKVPTILIAAFAAFALSAGFTVTGALLAPTSAAAAGYAYAPAFVPATMMSTSPMMSAPPIPRMASPPLVPAAMAPLATVAALPMTVSTVEQIAHSLRQAGEAGRRVTVVGAMRNSGTTYAAITLARALAKDANVVLVDLAFGAPNLSVISTDPDAPGIADLVRGSVSFGDIITRDQYSNVHLVATGAVGNDAAMLSASPMLATVIEALVQSYNHVVIDVGSAADVALERFAPLAHRAVLVAADRPIRLHSWRATG